MSREQRTSRITRLRHTMSAIAGKRVEPLFVSAAATSAQGAIATLIAAHVLQTQEFAQFATMTLLVSISQGLLRATLHEPAMVIARYDPGASITARRFFLYAALAAPTFAAATVILTHASVIQAFEVTSGAIAVWSSDYARYRLITIQRRKMVALGDLARIPVALALALPGLPRDAFNFAAIASASAAVLVAISLPSLIRHSVVRPVEQLRRQAAPQLADYVVLQLSANVPLLILGSASSVPLFAAVRLAQTLFGPLNLVFSAINSTLTADGSTRQSLVRDQDLLDHARRLSRTISVVSCAAVAAIALAVALWASDFTSIAPNALLLGSVLVGATYVGSGWAGIRVVLLRLLRRASAIVWARLALVSIVSLSYAIPAICGRLDISLAIGMATNAVAYPMIFRFVTLQEAPRKRSAVNVAQKRGTE